MPKRYSILSGLWRMYTQFYFARKWFCDDKPIRDEVGHEHWPMSEADKERMGLKEPDQKNPCAA